ncbi:ABC transporter ATP-binding protein [Paenibacillus sp. J2TS4]|uniref:ABC transporter ATP-binding protein n=1 Tax=Paenibacillus sp. J2TS4 TaxID=2807194 RepID=UPI001B227948|nr:ABC transporter ATP-binding protein [Paenibacillus sp. J2TS4]GIP30978.1 macrolide ABC transporter ATP-binding protein [Paenibacillus sp. J2TS4]
MIAIKNLCKTYPVDKENITILHRINLTIEQGEMVAIQGRSGAGKTTLFNVIGCLDTFDDGEYYFENQNIVELKDSQLAKLRCQKIGFVLQDFALVTHQTALFNVMLPLFFDKISYKKMEKKAIKALKAVAIEELANKKISQLSGGQRQRVAIARAIVNDPQLILADEPTGALDSETSQQIMQLLQRLNQEEQMTVLIITHDDVVADHCKRRIEIKDGRIIVDRLRNSDPLLV